MYIIVHGPIKQLPPSEYQFQDIIQFRMYPPQHVLDLLGIYHPFLNHHVRDFHGRTSWPPSRPYRRVNADEFFEEHGRGDDPRNLDTPSNPGDEFIGQPPWDWGPVRCCLFQGRLGWLGLKPG